MVQWTHRQPPSIQIIAFYAIVHLLSHVADAVFTVYAIENGIGEECIPLFVWALSRGYGIFVAIKIGVAVTVTTMLALSSVWIRFAWIAFRLITVGYLLLVVYHVVAGEFYLVS